MELKVITQLPVISTDGICCVQLMNAVSTLDRDAVNHMHQQLMKLRSCKGHKECNPETGESYHLLDESHEKMFPHNTLISLIGGKERSLLYDYRYGLSFIHF